MKKKIDMLVTGIVEIGCDKANKWSSACYYTLDGGPERCIQFRIPRENMTSGEVIKFINDHPWWGPKILENTSDDPLWVGE